MKKNEDIRWRQRFDNYVKALAKLEAAVALYRSRALSDLEKQGLVQAFEFTHELAWNVIKDFYEQQGSTGLQGSRDAVRLAFKRGLIENGDVWMDMIKSRNRTAHTYDEATVDEITGDICAVYCEEFVKLKEALELAARE